MQNTIKQQYNQHTDTVGERLKSFMAYSIGESWSSKNVIGKDLGPALQRDWMKYSHEYRLEESIVSMNIHRAINNEGNSNWSE